jgi:ferritin
MEQQTITAISEQIGMEFFNAQAYARLASVCDSMGFSGLAKHYRGEVDSEFKHATALVDLLMDLGYEQEMSVYMGDIPDIKSILEVVNAALALEKQTQDKIESIFEMPGYAKDAFFLAFAERQAKDTAEAAKLLDLITFAGDDVAALLSIDQGLRDA